MKPRNDITTYVSSLRGRLHLRPEVLERIITETEAHLQDRTAAHMGSGIDRREAESLAVAEFGPAWRVALRFRLAYLDLKKVLAWISAVLVVGHHLWGAFVFASDPHGRPWFASLEYVAGYPTVSLICGLVCTALFPRKLWQGAALISMALTAFVVRGFVNSADRLGYYTLVGHVWKGWRSGILFQPVERTIAGTSVPYHSSPYCLTDLQILGWLLMNFVWILVGVWVAEALREKIAGRRARRALA